MTKVQTVEQTLFETLFEALQELKDSGLRFTKDEGLNWLTAKVQMKHPIITKEYVRSLLETD